MKVSVIITYHGEDIYLNDCLISLSEQAYKDFEVVLVASGADEPSQITSEYGDLNIKVIKIDQENVSAARNTGLEAAAGEYVLFLDCDDYLDEDYIANLLECGKDGCELMFGRMIYTWYKREFFLKKESAESDESDEEGQASDSDSEADEESVVYIDNIEAGDSEDVIKSKRIEMAERYLVSKRKNFYSVTALGNMYSRQFLLDNNIKFDEGLEHFYDIPFLAQVLDKCEYVNADIHAHYIKRRHNDPIHLPSLSQTVGKEEFDCIYKAYTAMLGVTEKGTELRKKFERKLVSFYASGVAPAIKKNEDKAYRKKHAPKLKELMRDISPDVYSGLPRYRKKLIDALKNDDYGRISKIISRRNIVNMLKYSVTHHNYIRKVKDIMYKHRYSKQPVMQNVVLFESFFGKSYSDSPKYIFEKLNEMYPGKYECVWILEKKTRLPYPAKQIKRFSFAYFKYLARAKYIVFNSRQPKSFIKRKGNIFLETWHGTPLKKLVFDMDDVLSASPTYKKNFYIQSRSWDYLVAANGFSDEVFRRAFEYDKHMLKFGYPRNDILHSDNRDEIAARIKNRIGIPSDKKVVLYAPTWRDDEYYEAGKYKFTLQLDLGKMKKELGDEYVIILRTHYFIADKIDVTGAEDFVYNLSKYDDIAELYLISDILITDYSSVFFDYANLKRPMLFFTYDLDKYRDVLRGFYIDMEKEIPGPLVFDTDEVIDSIKNIDKVQEKYAPVYDVFYERFCGWEDGHASENCIKEVFK